MKIFDFLYYCFYCLVKKRPNDGSHIRALTLLGITLINSLANSILYFFLIFNIKFNQNYFLYFVGLIVVLNITLNTLENHFYINNDRYKIPLALYSNLFSKKEKWFLGLLALFLIIGTTISFIFVGISVNN